MGQVALQVGSLFGIIISSLSIIVALLLSPLPPLLCLPRYRIKKKMSSSSDHHNDVRTYPPAPHPAPAWALSIAGPAGEARARHFPFSPFLANALGAALSLVGSTLIRHRAFHFRSDLGRSSGFE